MTAPIIDKEFQSLIPPLSSDEYEQLKANILADGCREPLSLWNVTILDGHNRFTICQEHGLDFGIVQIETVTSRTGAVNWIINNQLGRRNLTPMQISYLRGKRYEQEKKTSVEVASMGGAAKYQNDTQLNNIKTTSQRIAKETGVGEATIKRDAQFTRAVDTLADIAGDDVRTSILQYDTTKTRQDIKALAGEVKDKPKGEAARHIMNVMGSSASPEWYTPPHIIELTLELFGTIDTDPCSNSNDTPNVPAKLLYTKDDDGLAQAWRGKVYMNPPYGRDIPLWTAALVAKYEAGEIDEAIALLPGRIDTRWFQPLYEFLICNIRGRLNYPQSSSATPFPSVIIYLGKNNARFVDVFKKIGPILQRID